MWTVRLTAEFDKDAIRSAQFGSYETYDEALEVAVKLDDANDDRYGDLGKIGIIFDVEPVGLTDAVTWTHAVVTESLGWDPDHHQQSPRR